MRILVAIAIAALAALTLLPGAALAQEYPPEAGGVSVSCDFSDPTVECDGQGFAPDTEVDVEVTQGGSVTRTDTVTADGSGNVSYSFDPECTSDSVEVTMSGENADGNPDSGSDTVDISDCGEGLPSTGGPFPGALGAGLALAGILGLVYMRRRDAVA